MAPNRRLLLLIAGMTLAACGTAPSPAPSEPVGWETLAGGGPLSPRHGAQAFWTGEEVIVLAGSDSPACPPNADCPMPEDPPLRDVAAWEPATGTWRRLAPAPVPIGHASGAVVGGVLYVAVPGVGPAAGVEARFLGFHIGEDRWLDLEPPPDGLDGIRLVAAGRHVVAVHGSQENELADDQIYDPASRTWAAVPRDPLAPSYDRTAVWTGAELVLFGIRIDPGRPANAPPVWSAATWNPALDEWRRLPDSQIAGGHAGWSIAGGRIVNAAIGGADGGEVNNWGRRYPFGGMLTSPAGEWSALPNPPEERGGFATLVAAGGEHVVTDGWVLHVPTGDWTPLERPPDGPDEGTAAVWAGDRLFAWGGVRWEPEQALLADGWTWRP